MKGWERVQIIMKNEGFNKNSFSGAIGLNNNVTITRILNEKREPSPATFKKIADRFPKYSRTWILTGKGAMLSSQSNNVTINGNENQNNIGGQNIKISLPESETQKIIKPDGSVEIQNSSLGNNNSNEINRLKEELHLKEIELAKCEAIIKSKDDMICMLKEILDRH